MNSEPRLTRGATRNLLATSLAAVLMGLSLAAQADNSAAAPSGDADAGKTKAALCGACHGADGNSSVNPDWPRLAGQHPGYFVAQLKAYKDGSRENLLMSPNVAALGDTDMHDLAAYFAAQTPGHGEADASLVDAGRKLYLGGNLEKGVSACSACHGPNGRGNRPAEIPAIGGQHAAYVKTTLAEYAAGKRPAGRGNMMPSIAGKLTAEEIDALAAFIQGLH